MDTVGILMSAALTFAGLMMPLLLPIGVRERGWVGFAALFLAGVFLSYLRRQRIWSYAAGSFLAALTWYVVPAAAGPAGATDPENSLAALIVMYAAPSILCAACVTAGAIAASAAGHRGGF